MNIAGVPVGKELVDTLNPKFDEKATGLKNSKGSETEIGSIIIIVGNRCPVAA
ncbi:MAG: hypothetical protein WKF59_00010 [Chitinophagaceae bacterium]